MFAVALALTTKVLCILQAVRNDMGKINGAKGEVLQKGKGNKDFSFMN